MIMEWYFRNNILFVDVKNELSVDYLDVLERKIVHLLDDFGVYKVIMLVKTRNDCYLLDDFKRNYLKKYGGNLCTRVRMR